LDEIDTLPLALQSKLLTAIETKRVRRVGAVREQAVDVKVVAATQAELSGRVAAGQFRADLYHRLAVIVLGLPPLRDRGEDIVCLAQQFLQQYATAHRLPPKRLSQEAVAWLQCYDWPGNVRELSHLMERVTLLHPEARIDLQTLTRLCLPQVPSATHAAAAPTETDDQSLDEPARITQAEAHYREALALAEELGMRPLQAHCHRDLGTLYARRGRQEQAHTALVTAIESYRAMDMTFWLLQAEAALAQTGGAEEPEGGIP
jgi:DNA-binding NtrC family response regulator